MYPDTVLSLAERGLAACRDAGLKLAIAESCTGGLIGGCLTSISGASDVLDRGFIAYANEAKTDLLGVPEAMLVEHGAVSEVVARRMAEGALGGNTNISVSVTGIAGPGGGTDEKPVGRVHIASARTDSETLHREFTFDGDRDAVRMQAIEAALSLLIEQTQP
ncbi:MAG: CinA family protein [Alphaproteobacteria bacterium]